MDAGAFSSPKVAKAAENLSLILVHAAKPGARALMNKFGIKGFPTVVFTQSNGTETERLVSRDADAVAEQFAKHAEKHTRVTAWLESIDKALAAGKEAKKPVLILAVDDRNPASKMLETFFSHNASYKTVSKFAISKVAFSKKDETLKAMKIRKGATIYYVDPMDDKLRARKVSAGDPGKFKKQLEKLYDKFHEKMEKAAKADA